MGDTNLEYDEGFGMHTFKREICAEPGEEFIRQNPMILAPVRKGRNPSCLNLRFRPVCAAAVWDM